MNTFTNPVLKGFSPDPSVCAVGDDYYLVTSTFAYFPGVPIYHSKDLVNWKQIGNVLEREEQLKLTGIRHSQGIFAPSLRYNNGVFYMITTNVSYGGNFIVTAENPEGPWSDPYFLDNAPGIDPSLFFDDNGRCYYVGTRENPKGATYNGDWEVWLQEIDLNTMKLIGVSTNLWKGALRDAIWPEGPHLYKKEGYFYLMIAEGGTGFNHSITIARSKSVDGPYIGNKNNPILTHRHLGKQFPVHNVGHGDLVETPDREWFLTCLASRMYDGYSNLGRETFLAKVEWEDGWPVINPGEGRLLDKQQYILPRVQTESIETYDLSQYNHAFMYLRNPIKENYDSINRKGWVRLKPTAVTLHDLDSPTYLGIRQQSVNYTFTSHIDAELKENEEAGIAVIQNERYSIRLVLKKSDEKYKAQMITTIDGNDNVVGVIDDVPKNCELEFSGERQRVQAKLRYGNKELIVAEGVDVHYLSTEVAGGFVGCTMGIYTSSVNDDSGYADFEWLKLVDNTK